MTTAALALTLASLATTGAPPTVFGIRWAGDGPLEDAGIDAWQAGVAVGVVASLLDVPIGYALLRERRVGVVGAVTKLPLDLALATGFGLPPAPLLVYPARLALIAWGRRERRSRSGPERWAS